MNWPLLPAAAKAWQGAEFAFLDPNSPFGIWAAILVPLYLFLAFKFLDARITPSGATFKKIIFSKSTLQDLKIGFGNILVVYPVFALLSVPTFSSHEMMSRMHAQLAEWIHLSPSFFSPVDSGLGADLIYIAVLLLGMNFGLWLSHFLMHKVGFLWEIHKLHHGAEYLTGLTNNRNHFLDDFLTALFGGFFMAVTGLIYGLLVGTTPLGWSNPSALYLMVLLQSPINFLLHIPVWISFGQLEFAFTSPAMHQLHHSADPRHFNKNFGVQLSIFDTLFGTLQRSERTPPENLTLGLRDGFKWNEASFWQTLQKPIVSSLSHFRLTRPKDRT